MQVHGSKFFQLSSYCTFVAIKYIWWIQYGWHSSCWHLKGSQFRVSKEPVTNFWVLNNPAGDDLIYKTVLKKPTWFLGYNAANFRKMSLSFVFNWALQAAMANCHTQEHMDLHLFSHFSGKTHGTSCCSHKNESNIWFFNLFHFNQCHFKT